MEKEENDLDSNNYTINSNLIINTENNSDNFDRDTAVSGKKELEPEILTLQQQDLVFTKTSLGKGSLGEVVLAKWRDSRVKNKYINKKQLVAVKKVGIRKGFEDTDTISFEKELYVLGTAKHKNVVHLLGRVVGKTWLVMPYFKKGSLYGLIAKYNEKGKSIRWALLDSLSQDILSGLNYLHNLEPAIILRDMKSKNILIDDSNQAKITDFGMARISGVQQLTFLAEGTNYTNPIGTMTYIAPEVLKSFVYSKKSDMYATGVVLWEIANQRLAERAYRGLGVSEFYKFRRNVPQLLQQLIKSCLEPAHKRPSAVELLQSYKKMNAASMLDKVDNSNQAVDGLASDIGNNSQATINHQALLADKVLVEVLKNYWQIKTKFKFKRGSLDRTLFKLKQISTSVCNLEIFNRIQLELSKLFMFSKNLGELIKQDNLALIDIICYLEAWVYKQDNDEVYEKWQLLSTAIWQRYVPKLTFLWEIHLYRRLAEVWLFEKLGQSKEQIKYQLKYQQRLNWALSLLSSAQHKLDRLKRGKNAVVDNEHIKLKHEAQRIKLAQAWVLFRLYAQELTSSINSNSVIVSLNGYKRLIDLCENALTRSDLTADQLRLMVLPDITSYHRLVMLKLLSRLKGQAKISVIKVIEYLQAKIFPLNAQLVNLKLQPLAKSLLENVILAIVKHCSLNYRESLEDFNKVAFELVIGSIAKHYAAIDASNLQQVKDLLDEQLFVDINLQYAKNIEGFDSEKFNNDLAAVNSVINNTYSNNNINDKKLKNNIPIKWSKFAQITSKAVALDLAINDKLKILTNNINKNLIKALNFMLPSLGQAPCEYSILATGSWGREQLGPYSDLDLIILINTNKKVKQAHPPHNFFIMLIDLLQNITRIYSPQCQYMEGQLKLVAHYIDEGDVRDLKSNNPSLLNTTKGLALQALSYCQSKNTEKTMFGFSLLHTCLLYSSNNKPKLYIDYQNQLNKLFKLKPDNKLDRAYLYQSIALKYFTKHAKDYQTQIKLNNTYGWLDVKQSVCAPLNYYLLDLGLYYCIITRQKDYFKFTTDIPSLIGQLSTTKINDSWLKALEQAWAMAQRLRIEIESANLGHESKINITDKQTQYIKLNNKQQADLELLQSVVRIALSAITPEAWNYPSLHIAKNLKQNIATEAHRLNNQQTRQVKDIVSLISFAKFDIISHRRCFLYLPKLARNEFLNNLEQFESSNKEIINNIKLLQQTLGYVPLPNGARDNYFTRDKAWQNILINQITSDKYSEQQYNDKKYKHKILLTWQDRYITHNRLVRDDLVKSLFTAGGIMQAQGLPNPDSKYVVSDGRRTVLRVPDKQDIIIAYLKPYPEFGGRQLAIDNLAYRVSGNSVQATLCLLTPLDNPSYAYPVMLSKAAGISLQQLYKQQDEKKSKAENSNQAKQKLQSIDSYLFTNKIFETIISQYEDDKTDNLTQQQHINPVGNKVNTVISIDTARAFEPWLTADRKASVKSIMFCFDKMLSPLHPLAVEEFLSLDAYSLVQSWLEYATKMHKAYNVTSKTHNGIFSEKIQEYFGSQNSTNTSFSFLPIIFAKNTVGCVYQNIERIQEALLENQNQAFTHFQLLKKISPGLYSLYIKAFNLGENPIKRFKILHSNYTDEKHISTQHTIETNVTKILHNQSFSKALKDNKFFTPDARHAQLELSKCHKYYLTQGKKKLLDKLNKLAILGPTEQDKLIEELSPVLTSRYYDGIIDRAINRIEFKVTKNNRSIISRWQKNLLNKCMGVNFKQLNLRGWLGVDNTVLYNLLEHSGDLQFIDMRDTKVTWSNSLWRQLALKCPALESIKIDKINEITTYSRRLFGAEIIFTQLREFTVTNSDIYKIVLNAPNLQSLKLSKANNLNKLTTTSKKLQSIILSDCNSIKQANFMPCINSSHIELIQISSSNSLAKIPIINLLPWLGIKSILADINQLLLTVDIPGLVCKQKILKLDYYIFTQYHLLQQLTLKLQAKLLEPVASKLLQQIKTQNSLFNRKSWKTRLAAIVELELISPLLTNQQQITQVLAALIKASSDEEEEYVVIKSAVRGLAAIYKQLADKHQLQVLEILIKSSSDKEYVARTAVLQVLVTIYDHLAYKQQELVLKVLIKASADKASAVVREEAVQGLAAIYNKLTKKWHLQIFNILIKAISEKINYNSYKIRAKFRALVVQGLVTIYNQLPEKQQQVLLKILINLSGERINICSYKVRAAAAQGFATIYNQLAQEQQQLVLEILIKVSGERSDRYSYKVRSVAAQGLANIYNQLADKWQKKVLGRLIESSCYSNSAALHGLVTIYNKLAEKQQLQVLGILIKVSMANYHQTYSIREVALQGLANIYNQLTDKWQKKVLEILIKASDDRIGMHNYEVRSVALRGLANIYNQLADKWQKKVLEILIKACEGKYLYGVKEETLQGLATIYNQLADKQQQLVLEILINATTDKNSGIRVAVAAETLGIVVSTIPLTAIFTEYNKIVQLMLQINTSYKINTYNIQVLAAFAKRFELEQQKLLDKHKVQQELKLTTSSNDLLKPKNKLTPQFNNKANKPQNNNIEVEIEVADNKINITSNNCIKKKSDK